jgi:hypothetical protein
MTSRETEVIVRWRTIMASKNSICAETTDFDSQGNLWLADSDNQSIDEL